MKIGINLLFALTAMTTSIKALFVGAKQMKTLSRMFSITGGSVPDKDELKPFYALGISVAKQVGGELKSILSKDELEAMISGYSDEILSKVQGDSREYLAQYGPILNEELQKRSLALVGSEKKKGEEYMISYLLRNPKAVKTPSGLIFDEILVGTGSKPSLQNTVKVHYHGTLIDGTVFDSSVNRGEPISFPLTNVIKGWQEGVQMMNVGGKATIIVPSDIAYGDNGSPPVIPPGATLQFEIQLLEVQ